MLRLILYALIGLFLYRIVYSVTRLMSSGRSPHASEDPFAPPKSPRSSAPRYKDVQDAEFEDITPKKTSDEKPPPPAP